MQLTVLGSAGGYPMPGVAASGYLVDHENTRIWCDIGPGTLMRFPGRLKTVDAVVISHEHPDHCLDLLALFHALAYPLEPRSGVPVFAPREVIDKVRAFVRPDQIDLIDRTFAFTAVADGSIIEVGAIRVSFAEATHPVHTLAMRFDAGGRSLAYSGDTGPDGDWKRVAESVDVFLCEATFVGTRRDFPYPYHLNAGEAGTIARASGANELILTHIPVHWNRTRSLTEARARFGSAVGLADPGRAMPI